MADGRELGWVARAPLPRLIATAVAAAAALGVLLALSPLPTWGKTGVIDLTQVAVITGAVTGCVGRRRREEGRGRLGWTLIGGGFAVVGCSVAVAAYRALVLHDLSPAGWRDAITSLGLLVFASGLVSLCGAPLTSRLTSLVDTGMAAGACMFVLWLTLLSPPEGSGMSDRAKVLIGYLGGMSLLLILALLLAARWRGDGRTLTLVGAGLGIEVATLIGLGVLNTQGHDVAMDDPRVGLVFPLGTALLGLAAAQRASASAGWAPMRRQWNLALGLPAASGAVVVATGAALTLAGRAWDTTAVVLAITVWVLLFVRQGLTLLENRRLTLDLEERVAARTGELVESRKHFRDLVQHSSDLIAVVSRDGRVTYCSPAVTRMLGYGEEELLGRSGLELVHPEDAPRLEGLSGDEPVACRVRHADGSWRRIEATVGRSSVVRQDPTYVVNIRDVTERHLLEERLRYQAYHDPLTGLANRALMQERMHHALLRARRTREKTALVFVDLDDFKRLNDSAGHGAGDEALVHVADVIRACIRPHDTAARLGGDEFAVLLEDADEGEGSAVAGRIVDALRQLPIPHQRTYLSGASAGVSVVDAGASDSEALLRDADIAMYQAKASGRGRAAVFTEDMREELVKELEMESALRAALAADALDVAYQPIVDLATGTIAAVEALVRWRDASGTQVPPCLFIPLAERVGLIGELDRWVLRRATAYVAGVGLRCPDLAGITLNVNLSARDLADTAGVEHSVAGALADSGLAPRRLVLEITETAVLPDVAALFEPLQALRRRGVRISLDDFGTGYSSMASLKHLPLDEIKIDGSFVAGLPDGESAARVVEGIVSMARSLGLPVVAEAVETDEHLEHLRRMHCDYAQGWRLAAPMTPEELEGWGAVRLEPAGLR